MKSICCNCESRETPKKGVCGPAGGTTPTISPKGQKAFEREQIRRVLVAVLVEPWQLKPRQTTITPQGVRLHLGTPPSFLRAPCTTTFGSSTTCFQITNTTQKHAWHTCQAYIQTKREKDTLAPNWAEASK